MSRPLVRPARKPGLCRLLASVSVGAVVGSSLVLAASPASAVVTTTSNPDLLSAALAGAGANITAASFDELPPTGTPHAVSTSPLAGSPTEGPSFAVLTTGNAALADDPNSSANSGADLGGAPVRGDTDQDVSVLKLSLDVPTTANCLSFDFTYLSEEYPEWVNSAYNDAFIAELDASTWTTSDSAITAPDNFAFDTDGEVISVKAVGLGGFSAANAAGTTYDGATTQLSAATQVTPGAHSLYLSIFDQGDGILDSAAFVDNLRVGFVADPATECKSGAQVKDPEPETPPDSPPANDAGGPYTGDEGSATSISGTAGDIDGDTLTHSWTYSAVSGVDGGATCSFADSSALTTTVTCTDDGTYELTLTTDDGVNDSVADNAQLTVGNLQPSVGSVTTPIDPVSVGSAVQLDATYADPGSNDTHTASVDWGDGTTTSPAASDGVVSTSHSYSAAGIYTVCLTVTVDETELDTECSPDYVVVYDPGAGLVTGGGWIDAPAGSFPADPSVSGPARFGFVSRYYTGASTPEGNTEFQFSAGDLNFQSSSYDWLVIAGSKAIYKGEGSVNGESGYKFLLSAVDGAKPGGGGVDRFRVKIWNASTDVVVFDNQIGASDSATATTAISKGSIMIRG